MDAVVTPETARLWSALIGLGVMTFGLALVIFSRRVADNMKATPSGYPRSKAVVQLIGLAFMAAGIAIAATGLLGS